MGSVPVAPVERPAMQVHHCFDEEHVAPPAVNDGVGKAMAVELAVVVTDGTPARGFSHDPAQGRFELGEKLLAQTRLALVVPNAAANSSCRASGWLTTRIELAADVPKHFVHRLAIHLPLFNLARPTVKKPPSIDLSLYWLAR